MSKIDKTNNFINTAAQSATNKLSNPNYKKSNLSDEIDKNLTAYKETAETFNGDKDKNNNENTINTDN